MSIDPDIDGSLKYLIGKRFDFPNEVERDTDSLVHIQKIAANLSKISPFDFN